MTTFAIGDLQGCRDELLRLLDRIGFDPGHDRLLLLGDLVNRGPDSVGVLRAVRALGTACTSLLGNHDLHLLAAAFDPGRLKPGDTLRAVLEAPDADELLGWLAARPLAWSEAGHLFVHAGLPPQWTAAQALALAAEASQALAADRGRAFFDHMYGDRPDRWDEALTGWERLRFVINCLTRLRYCTAEGVLRLRDKGAPGTQAADALPWFAVPGRRSADTPVVFGHWSTLGRVAWPGHRVWGLDTGCLWGGALTALALETGAITALPCAGYCVPGNGD